MNRPEAEIETARLSMSPFAWSDLEELAIIRADPEVMRYIGTGKPHDMEQVRVSLERKMQIWEQHNFGQWAVRYQGNEKLLGWCGLDFLDETPEIEVGYGFAREFWGQGMAAEAARASLRYGFSQMSLEHIAAVAMHENIASQRVMQKIGMKFIRHAFFYDYDVVYYSITRDEFRSDE
jgi:ribosomal-protein-alanine N-acetyltransferase